jgi:phosphate transport system substrate-binding protein
MSGRIGIIALAAVGALSLAACGGEGGGGDSGGLSGTVAIDGSSTVFPVTEAVAEEFQIANPGVRVTVGISGTGGGFKKFCDGETDVSDASRPIKDSEKEACAAKGIEYTEIPVSWDGITVVKNPANDWAQCLTVDELKRIWQPGSSITNWNQIRPEFPDQELILYGPDTDSGTFDYFTEVITGGDGASRSDYTASADDNVLVVGVEGDPGALGYFGFAYYEQSMDKLGAIAVDNGNGCVTPSRETINDGTYAPLSRPMFIYPKKSAMERPEVRAFVEFYLKNAAQLVPEVGYVELKPENYQESLQKLGLAQ